MSNALNKRVFIEPLREGYFSLSFPYNRADVAAIRRLGNRRWNPAKGFWEVAILHLGEVMHQFGLNNKDIDKKLLRQYQLQRLSARKVKCTVNHLTATLHGSGLPLQQIDDATSFFLPGYKYMPRFKNGQWDGRRHLFNQRRNSFPAGLLPRVSSIMAAERIECEIIYEEPETQEGGDTSSPGKLGAQAPTVELRDYQLEAVQAALSAKRGVLEIATGGGKTLIAAQIIYELQLPTVFLVHTLDLLHQTRQVLKEYLGIPIGQAGYGVIDLQPVTVATVQTCAKAMEVKLEKTDEDTQLDQDRTDLTSTAADLKSYLQTVPMVFFDECHHVPADTMYGLAMGMSGAGWRFGLSATPYRSDRMDLLLEAALGTTVYHAGAGVLVEKGFLVPPKIQFLKLPRFSVKQGQADYPEVFNHYVVENAYRNGRVAEVARSLVEQKKSVLILVTQVRHGEALLQHLPEAVLVQGTDPPKERQKVFKALEKKKQKLVIATTLADEGLDVPSLNAVILASAGKSETRSLQRVGRALRPSPGKKQALVYDFLDDAPFLKEHAQHRLEIFRKEPHFEVLEETALPPTPGDEEDESSMPSEG